ncbi:NAD(P)H-dependent oxidoreductase [Roseinatronobacter alkalisoli]|uniref:NAD(P)H-dependent oxidoreductase n=1 Tax=Roseinatronobacter alkalisoli TaxID=3028235 RepID=A0ABT5T6V1_9RHOB|nr:NAD(P)H-dependent oxidoreductase [Roseinatronobacter sp. HJB301]MDD7970837.1 NAD(P)H-dependent oxidoreductase [Roseinatronobacter sp. HJB301]
MHFHILHAHPEPKSFNGALTERARTDLPAKGHKVTVTDLYAAGFDPVERGAHYTRRLNTDTFSPLAEQRHAFGTGAVPCDVRQEIAALERADTLVLQFPLWWHGPPAILKGWFDRVFLSGGIYTSCKRYDTGHFKRRRALVSVTSGAPESAFGPGARGGDPAAMLWPIHYSLHYLGFTVLPPFWTFGVQGHGYAYEDAGKTSQRLQQQLDAWAERLHALRTDQPLAFPGWNDWDAEGRATGQ